MDDRSKLLAFADCVGPVFGTEDFCLFLYSIVRMQTPVTIVELGTGFGVSTFAMALAIKCNGFGRIWTVDDFSHHLRDVPRLAHVVSSLQKIWSVSLNIRSMHQLYVELAKLLAVTEIVTFVHDRIDLDNPQWLSSYNFDGKTIDLLFSDFQHSPRSVLSILAHFLPLMSPASSIFIDSASTAWTSYLLLEQLVGQLNDGFVPQALQDLCTADLAAVMKNRRIILVHLTEAKDRDQNSTAWLKLEPIDVLPQPRTRMRGL